MDNESKTEPLPLAGIRVLDLGTFIAAPYAATILGEFGAEVIKIEKPGAGDPLRQFGTPSAPGATLCWLSEARNKHSITLNLAHKKGAALLRQLVRSADVVCENFRPGTLEGWGVGFEALLQENPRLIMLRVSGYGQDGPLRDKPGFARIAHAFGGLTHLTGIPDGPPLTPGSTSLADYISGLYGAIGVLIALQARDKVGGQYIDLALYESIFRMLDDIAPTYARTGAVRGRLGVGTINACPHGHFICGDGIWIALACSSDKMFARFARMIGKPGLAAVDRYAATRQRLDDAAYINGVVEAWLSGLSAREAVAACDRAGVPCAEIQTIADIFASEQFAARKNLVEMMDADQQSCVVPNVIPRLSLTPGSVRHLGPALGDANSTVFHDLLGLSGTEIAEMRREGVI
ncbi:CaiB/BaiF CoA transferase family protein [Sphingosinicella microcystinivorans]|uniref:CaiB/BaiF CoA transferase family protein n=1 Tax=Sphingosinicella microcystinivorans TaxID=335406 RepID=UPI0022F3BA34|nr:CoA transferase [Sphingosinicella microcystinivorans]WBX86125.1 CoA transferase [Sphingosinicella microcystinivorans]